jgi:MFS family permease
VPFREVLFDAQLLRLNFGIFTLHAVQMAMFVVIPGMLVASGSLPLAEHWKVYLPAVLVSFVLMVPAIIVAEKYNKVQPVFLIAIGLLLATLLLLWQQGASFAMVAGGLLSFFVAFNILEAMLPSLVSRVAPARAKGAALGIYNTTQAFGLFLGGALGGWLANNLGGGMVFLVGAVLTVLWLAAAATMASVPLRRTPAADAGHGILDSQ